MKKKSKNDVNHVVNHEKTREITGFRAVFMVKVFFWRNITKLDFYGKNTHSPSFLKIFDHLLTQERRLKGARSVKSWSLISKRAARSLMIVPLVNFYLIIQEINRKSQSNVWHFFTRPYHFYFVKVFVQKNRADLQRWSAVLAFFGLISIADQKKSIRPSQSYFYQLG